MNTAVRTSLISRITQIEANLDEYRAIYKRRLPLLDTTDKWTRSNYGKQLADLLRRADALTAERKQLEAALSHATPEPFCIACNGQGCDFCE